MFPVKSYNEHTAGGTMICLYLWATAELHGVGDIKIYIGLTWAEKRPE